MTGKHRTTVYLDHEITMLAKARKINLSATLESVLKSMVGVRDPDARILELKDELTILENAKAEVTIGPLGVEIAELRTHWSAGNRQKFTRTENENWLVTRTRDFPRIRDRFMPGEVLDLMMDG